MQYVGNSRRWRTVGARFVPSGEKSSLWLEILSAVKRRTGTRREERDGSGGGGGGGERPRAKAERDGADTYDATRRSIVLPRQRLFRDLEKKKKDTVEMD